MDILTKMKTVFVGMLIIPMITIAEDNEIVIPSITGNDIEINITQIGYANTIQCYNTTSC